MKHTNKCKGKKLREFFFGGTNGSFLPISSTVVLFLLLIFFSFSNRSTPYVFLERPQFCKKITIFILYLFSQPPPKQETWWQRSSIFHRDHKSLSYPRHYPLRIFAPTSTHIYLWNNSLHFYAVWITCLYLFQAVPFWDYGSPTWQFFLLPYAYSIESCWASCTVRCHSWLRGR